MIHPDCEIIFCKMGKSIPTYLQNFTLPISENRPTDDKAREDAAMFEEMTNPMTKQTIPSEMTCNYIGRHDFSIDLGRWENIKGEFRINSTGIMNSRVFQDLAMMPIDR